MNLAEVFSMNTTWRVTSVLVLLCSLLVGCERRMIGTEVVEDVGGGAIQNDVFTHEEFGLQIEPPDGWRLVAGRENDHLTDLGASYSGDVDEEQQEALDAVKRRTLVLVTVVQENPKPVEQPSDNEGLTREPRQPPQPNLVVVAERIDGVESVESAQDYLETVQSHLASSLVVYHFEKPRTGHHVGDREATRLDARTSTGRQRFYTSIVGNYALTVVLSAATSADLNELETIRQSIELRP